MIAALALVVSVAACGGTGDAGSVGATGGDESTVARSAAEARYGYAPKPDPHVKLQPDVVLIGGGPEAIKAASSDGLSWLLDGQAEGVQDLRPGKIMFASSLALGRVVALRKAGEDVETLIAPVQITDVIRDGTLSIDKSLDLDAMTFQLTPDQLGGVVRTPSSSESGGGGGGGAGSGPTRRLVAPTLRMYAAPPAAGQGPWGRDTTLPPPKGGPNATVKVGDWSFTPSKSGNALGLSVTYKAAGNGLQFNSEFALDLKNSRIQARLPVTDGRTSGEGALVSGIRALRANVTAGTAQGTTSNAHKIVTEVPIDLLVMEVPIYGIPTTVKITFKFLVKFGFTSKHSIISAKAFTTLHGMLGTGGTATADDSTSKTLESIKATGLGVTGIALAYQVGVTWGIGIPDLMVGPYANITAAYGYSTGSPMGAPLGATETCRAVTETITAEWGVGMSASKSIVDGIDKAISRRLKTFDYKDMVWDKSWLKKLTWVRTAEAAAKSEKTLFNVSRYAPRIKLCKPE
jgi:hypothetical protein